MTITLPTASFWLKYLHPEIVRLGKPVAGWFYTISANGDLSVSLLALVILGLGVGLLSSSFGVGSGFLMTPFLNLVGNIPYNVAIGSDVAHMLGSSTLANLRQRALGYVDYKLGLLLFAGSVVGVEIGARLVQVLKFAGEIPQGALVHLTCGDSQSLLQATEIAVRQALGELGGTKPALAFAFCCMARRILLGRHTREEAQRIMMELGPVPLIGFYTYGEFSPAQQGTPSVLHNETATLAIIG